MRGLYEETKPHLNEAFETARERWKQAKQTGSFNPSTKIHKLVDFLQDLRS